MIYTQGIMREQATGGTQLTLIQANETREAKPDPHEAGEYQSKTGINTHTNRRMGLKLGPRATT